MTLVRDLPDADPRMVRVRELAERGDAVQVPAETRLDGALLVRVGDVQGEDGDVFEARAAWLIEPDGEMRCARAEV